MGYSYGWNTKKELVDYFNSDNFFTNAKRLKSRLVGNSYWSVIEVTTKDNQKRTLITLELISKSEGKYGFKGLDETANPYYYNCPLSFLELANNPPPSEYSRKWREGVRQYHEHKKQLKEKSVSGSKILVNGVEYTLQRKLQGKKGWAVTNKLGLEFRISYQQLNKSKFI